MTVPIKDQLHGSKDLEKQLMANKSGVKERDLKLDHLDEATKLLDESAKKYDLNAERLEQHFESKWTKYLIGLGIVVGSVVLLAIGGQLYSSANSVGFADFNYDY